MTDLPISEQFRIIAKKWVEADAAHNLLEDTKSAVLAQRMMELGDLPVSRAEMQVKASDEWLKHIEAINAARERANLLKVQMEFIRMQFSEAQSAEANARAERRM